jgi:hypothetical protein
MPFAARNRKKPRRLRVCAERRQQAHQHAAMPADGALRDTAMPPQPILELDDLAIPGRGPRWRERSRRTQFHKEAHKAPDAVHVLCRNMIVPTGARAAAFVPRKPADNGVIDASSSNPRELKPLREVTGRGFVTGRELEQLELKLEELETAQAETEAAAETAPAIAEEPAPEEAPAKKTRRKLPDALPRREIVHEPACAAALEGRFSSSVLRCFGAATMAASMICPLMARKTAARSAKTEP